MNWIELLAQNNEISSEDERSVLFAMACSMGSMAIDETKTMVKNIKKM